MPSWFYLVLVVYCASMQSSTRSFNISSQCNWSTLCKKSTTPSFTSTTRGCMSWLWRRKGPGWTKSLQSMLPHALLGRHIWESYTYLRIIWCSSMSRRLPDARKPSPSCREHYGASVGRWHLYRKGPLACGELSQMVICNVGGEPPNQTKFSWWVLRNPSILCVSWWFQPWEPNWRDCPKPKLHRWEWCILGVLNCLCLCLLFWGEIASTNGVQLWLSCPSPNDTFCVNKYFLSDSTNLLHTSKRLMNESMMDE